MIISIHLEGVHVVTACFLVFITLTSGEPYRSENTLVEKAQGNDQNSADPSISEDDATITCRKSARKFAKPVYLKDYVTMVDAPPSLTVYIRWVILKLPKHLKKQFRVKTL